MLNQTQGQQIRNAQLDFFEERDSEFLSRCRSLAVQIAKRQGEVSINDVRKHIQVPSGTHPQFWVQCSEPSNLGKLVFVKLPTQKPTQGSFEFTS